MVKVVVLYLVLILGLSVAITKFEHKTGMSLGENVVRFICE